MDRRGMEGVMRRGSSLLVYILGKNEAGIYGMVLCRGLEQPVRFEGPGQLVLLIDDLCRERNTACPASLDKSAFMELGIKSYAMKCRARELLQISVAGHEHASLQGSVRGRLTAGKYVYFQSALELLRVLSTVLM